jgi:hypothetical protein
MVDQNFDVIVEVINFLTKIHEEKISNLTKVSGKIIFFKKYSDLSIPDTLKHLCFV